MTEYSLRMAAAEKGERRYWGKPCVHGHDGERYTSSGVCVACLRSKTDARQKLLRETLARNVQA